MPSSPRHRCSANWNSLHSLTTRRLRLLIRAGSPLLLRLELHRYPIHAVAFAGRTRTVGEHVSQMPTAAGAVHFGALGEPAPIDGRADGTVERLVETGPARTAVVLGIRAEE